MWLAISQNRFKKYSLWKIRERIEQIPLKVSRSPQYFPKLLNIFMLLCLKLIFYIIWLLESFDINFEYFMHWNYWSLIAILLVTEVNPFPASLQILLIDPSRSCFNKIIISKPKEQFFLLQENFSCSGKKISDIS